MSSDALLSPESTVTSLLATSGHLPSSLHPQPVSSITYRHKQYVSASDALDAYISDFQKSLLDSEASTGKLHVTKELSRPHPRNRDVLKTSLTDGELNFLNVPISKRDSDLLSMTTDDLLALPADGCLPVTRTSAFLSQSGNSSIWSQSRLNRTQKGFTQHPPQRVPPTERPSAVRKTVSCLPVDDSWLSGLRSHRQAPLPDLRLPQQTHSLHTPSRSHYLPRRLTSQKSDMDFSGMTSVPDLKYPGWLGQCEEPSSGSTQCPDLSFRVPSWVGDLEESSGKRLSDAKGHREVKGQLYGSESDWCELRQLRLQFSEKPEPVKRQMQDGQLFKDDRIGSLIFRAEQVLNSPSLHLQPSAEEHNSSADTEDALNADRSWDNPPVTYKSPVPVGDTDDPSLPYELQRNKSSASCSSGYSSRKHPGPVEALKHMLFSLQAVEHNISSSDMRPTADSPSHLQRGTEEQLETEQDDLNTSGESLQRSLHHLERLKTLVADMTQKKDRSQNPAAGVTDAVKLEITHCYCPTDTTAI